MTLKNDGEIFSAYIPPNFDEWFMKQVYLIAEKSKDPSTKIGALLVKDNRIISTGYNGFPINVKDLPDRYNDREIKYKFIVHGEDNAVLSAARFGISTIGSTLYTQTIPCNDCTKSVIQGGVTNIVLHSNWPIMNHSKWKESVEFSLKMLNEANIKIKYLNAKLDVSAYINGKKYSV